MQCLASIFSAITIFINWIIYKWNEFSKKKQHEIKKINATTTAKNHTENWLKSMNQNWTYSIRKIRANIVIYVKLPRIGGPDRFQAHLICSYFFFSLLFLLLSICLSFKWTVKNWSTKWATFRLFTWWQQGPQRKAANYYYKLATVTNWWAA